MKRYTINLGNNNNIFRNNNTANASKNLDDLILGNLIKMNPYLGNKKKDDTLTAMLNEAKNNDRIFIPIKRSYSLKDKFDSTEFIKAAKFLANYKPDNSYIKLDDTIIKFFEDEIQIGYDLIPLYDLTRPAFLSSLDEKTKSIIINIYITING